MVVVTGESGENGFMKLQLQFKERLRQGGVFDGPESQEAFEGDGGAGKCGGGPVHTTYFCPPYLHEAPGRSRHAAIESAFVEQGRIEGTLDLVTLGFRQVGDTEGVRKPGPPKKVYKARVASRRVKGLSLIGRRMFWLV